MLSDEEKTALEFIKINNEHKYCGKDDVDFLLNLIEKQSKIIQAMAGEIAQFRNECDLENDTKETVIEEYEEQYIIWRKFFKESR